MCYTQNYQIKKYHTNLNFIGNKYPYPKGGLTKIFDQNKWDFNPINWSPETNNLNNTINKYILLSILMSKLDSKLIIIKQYNYKFLDSKNMDKKFQNENI